MAAEALGLPLALALALGLLLALRKPDGFLPDGLDPLPCHWRNPMQFIALDPATGAFHVCIGTLAGIRFLYAYYERRVCTLL